ncbi:FliG C-terminal domain-containing protein [Paracoccus onubensis]|uniref:FliG C-terminal domain-containing protein n=1 Tax=Paracoccus onubensis TaxID=1675788 RepID=UPI0027302ADB|nr:FliG C-terminal domain-containing protein [Paracoccus onubensis]MDP0928229.1 FliG C-terminal domain-containing protein [Paracoccus onubensis]
MAVQTGLSPRQKAAIIVRLLLDDDDGVTLDNLNGERQALLFEEMARMDLIDRQTRDDVISEFCEHLESVGVTFPGDLDGTLEIMSDRLSKDSSDRLRRLVMMTGNGDPWPRILELSQEDIQSLADGEAVELIAVMLSKLPVEQAARTYTAMDPERARQVAQAMAMTRDISPQALRRVGLVLAQAADALPRPAIETKACDRMGDMLNFANADLRANVLEMLDEQDREFALDVRRAIFVFAHIPKRVEPRDVPRIVRDMNQQVLLRALSQNSGEEAAAAEFILSNLSQRMSENLRDEIASLGNVTPQDAEAATNEVVVLIRRLAAEGELTLIPPKDD